MAYSLAGFKMSGRTSGGLGFRTRPAAGRILTVVAMVTMGLTAVPTVLHGARSVPAPAMSLARFTSKYLGLGAACTAESGGGGPRTGLRSPICPLPAHHRPHLVPAGRAAPPPTAPRDNFGDHVSISGTTAPTAPLLTRSALAPARGRPTCSPSREAPGPSRPSSRLRDGAPDDDFGGSVSLSGNTALVGAPYHTVGSNTYQGAAYVFTESGGTWSQQAELPRLQTAPRTTSSGGRCRCRAPRP